MRFLDALIPARTERPRVELRETFQEWVDNHFTYAGANYQTGLQPITTWQKQPTEPIGNGFADYTANGLQSNGIISAIELVRFSVFAEARFQWQGFSNGRPGDLFGNPDLSILEHPWAGGTTGDLLSRMEWDAGLAGNAYVYRQPGRLRVLRPDWVAIVYGSQQEPDYPAHALDGDLLAGADGPHAQLDAVLLRRCTHRVQAVRFGLRHASLKVPDEGEVQLGVGVVEIQQHQLRVDAATDRGTQRPHVAVVAAQAVRHHHVQRRAHRTRRFGRWHRSCLRNRHPGDGRRPKG